MPKNNLYGLYVLDDQYTLIIEPSNNCTRIEYLVLEGSTVVAEGTMRDKDPEKEISLNGWDVADIVSQTVLEDLKRRQEEDKET